MRRFMFASVLFVCAFVQSADTSPWPLWDGQETVEHYARRAKLEAAKTVSLGGGVNLEFVLIPAGGSMLGMPKPMPVNEAAFRKETLIGQAILAASAGALLVLVGTIVIRCIRYKRRFQYSLARLIAMTSVAGVAVMGGMKWWESTKRLAHARANYAAALDRYKSLGFWERPAHHVTVTKPLYMGKYEVTQEQYQQVMGLNPSQFKGPKLPVEQVSFKDILEFCKKASEETSQSVEIPYNDEWEYACWAGRTSWYNTGDTEADLAQEAWYKANSNGKTHPVGQKQPNPWGLYDMHGNVSECSQCDYRKAMVLNGWCPAGAARGGGWGQDPLFCSRSVGGLGIDYDRPGTSYSDPICAFGFRVCLRVSP